MMNIIKRKISTGSLKLPDLAYDLHELQPVLTKSAMELHYLKHHNAYLSNFTKFQEDLHKAI